ncbi:hypothetical protein MMC25_005778 [Agyrium rufum]|nr:hypothetical protein [Agyrium rufum]
MATEDYMSDEYIAKLLAKDARESSIKYSTLGMQALHPKRSPTTNAPRANTRFLKNIIRETDSHNAALKAKEAEEAKERLRRLQSGGKDPQRQNGLRQRLAIDRHLSGGSTNAYEEKGKSNSERGRDRDPKRKRGHGRSDEDTRGREHRKQRREDQPLYTRRPREVGNDEAQSRQDPRHEHRKNGLSRSSRHHEHSSVSGDASNQASPDRDEDRRRRRHSHRHRSPQRGESSDSENQTSKGRTRHHRHHCLAKRSDARSPSIDNTPLKRSEKKITRGETNSKRQDPLEAQAPANKPRIMDKDDPSSDSDLLAPLLPTPSSDRTSKHFSSKPTTNANNRPRGRGAFTATSSTIDTHFQPTYNPTNDIIIEPPPSFRPFTTQNQNQYQNQNQKDNDDDDWDQALEALRDRQRWKATGAERLRAAGFSEEEVGKWERGQRYQLGLSPGGADDGRERDMESVRWAKKGEGREWDRGKVFDSEEEEEGSGAFVGKGKGKRKGVVKGKEKEKEKSSERRGRGLFSDDLAGDSDNMGRLKGT